VLLLLFVSPSLAQTPNLAPVPQSIVSGAL
jgi:hypothetical protein